MSNGEELLKAFKKLGCPNLENMDGDSLDWYFENPDLKLFLGEFISRVNSGHLQATEHVSNQSHGQQGISSCSTQLQEAKENFCLQKKNEQLEVDLRHKRTYAALLRKKLDLVKKQNAKDKLLIKSLETAANNNKKKLESMKTECQPMIKHYSSQLESLAKSNNKLGKALAEPKQSGTKLQESVKAKKSHATCLSSSSSLSSSVLAARCDKYVKKEKALLEHLDEVAEVKTLEPQEELNSEAEDLLQEWRTEQLRLHKCFSMTIGIFNYARTSESVLHKEIALLQKILENPSAAQAILRDAEKSQQSCEALKLSRFEIESRSQEACDELATKALSSLLSTNYKIKLQRLEQHIRNQGKVLHLLREQQIRLSFLQLSQKLESQRKAHLLTVCQNISATLKKVQTTHQEWIAALRTLKESQEPTVTNIVPAGDQVMETMAKVLGLGCEHFIYTFDSIAELAVKLNLNVELGRSTNQQSLELILEKLNELSIICEALVQIQEPYTASTGYHGNLQLVGAIAKLKEMIKSYTAYVLGTRSSFKKFKEDLNNCEREVFEREQKAKIALQKVNHKD